MFDFAILSVCAGCRKRKFFICRKWIKPKNLPKVRPNNKMCLKCLKIYQNI